MARYMLFGLEESSSVFLSTYIMKLLKIMFLVISDTKQQ